MKLITAFLILTLSSSLCKAQNRLLSIDEEGKFIYYERVEVKEVLKNQLKERFYSFLKTPFAEVKLKKMYGDSVMICHGKLMINKTLLVMSHPSGEIRYRFQVELKEGKFRFWFTDFNFVPYQRDRYGNFVASTNKGTPLERLKSSQWKEYEVQVTDYVFQFAKEFKSQMESTGPVVIPVNEKMVVKKDW